MKLFKITSVLLVVYFLMHTAGGMLSDESLGTEADRVFAAMKSVHFDFNGADSTWHGFWFGFGLMFSTFLAMSAFVAWKLESVNPQLWPDVSFIAWSLCAAHAICAILAFKYFFAGPGVFGVLISVLLAFGAIRMQRADLRI